MLKKLEKIKIPKKIKINLLLYFKKIINQFMWKTFSLVYESVELSRANSVKWICILWLNEARTTNYGKCCHMGSNKQQDILIQNWSHLRSQYLQCERRECENMDQLTHEPTKQSRGSVEPIKERRLKKKWIILSRNDILLSVKKKLVFLITIQLFILN